MLKRLRPAGAGLLLAAGLFLLGNGFAGSRAPEAVQRRSIPADRILTAGELLSYLKPGIPGLAAVYRAQKSGRTEQALRLLTDYLREKAADRYYFSWKTVPATLQEYRRRYPGAVRRHLALAREQMTTFPPEPRWKLPFRNLHGRPVTAYQLRHLARQQKAPDLAFAYYFSGRDVKYLRYFVRQVASLDRAFAAGQVEGGGNDVYERFRAGKRVHNWLFAHHLFLADSAYTWRDQLLLTATFLHHGAQLARRTRKFSRGNHHTKGLVGLFQIAVLFQEFQGTDRWRRQAVRGILKHLRREVNDDGFQFERSVHYHIGDIDNYFRVFQLARKNGIALPGEFTARFRSMFGALVRLAQPDRRLPVLQDCTDRPYAETVLMDRPMALGALLFGSPEYRYFAGQVVPPDLFWFFPLEEIRRFERRRAAPPSVGSTALRRTGYYVTRNGWERNSEYLVIDAGLSPQKPDHQQAGILGVVAYADGHEVLPNYQVAYSHLDFPFWKGPWAKNIALVDSVSPARGWRPNRGGSGFGKWTILARPKVLSWISRPRFDYFAGTHDGFDSLQVRYRRTVWFVKDGFWLIRDRFVGKGQHRFQQVWQGNFQQVGGVRHLRRLFPDGSGLDLVQLGGIPRRLLRGEKRGKVRVVLESPPQSEFEFLTLIVPFAEPGAAVAPDEGTRGRFGAWRINPALPELNAEAQAVLGKRGGEFAFVAAKALSSCGWKLRFSAATDLFVEWQGGLKFTVLAGGKRKVFFSGTGSLYLNGRAVEGNEVSVSPGDWLEVRR